MEKSIFWDNAQAKRKKFTITAYVSSVDEARRLVMAEIVSFPPQAISADEGAALLNWIYKNEPVIEPSSSPTAEEGVCIAIINEQ